MFVLRLVALLVHVFELVDPSVGSLPRMALSEFQLVWGRMVLLFLELKHLMQRLQCNDADAVTE